MKNKKIISIIIILTLLLSLTIVASASQDKHITNFDKADKLIELKQYKQESKTVAEIDGEEIKENDVKALLYVSNGAINEQQALDSVIRKKLLIKEAKSLGLEASLEDAVKVANEMREGFTQNATEQDIEVLNKVIKFLNISEDEYWNNYSVKGYRDMLTMGKLKEKIRTEAAKGIVVQTEQKNAYDKALNKLVDELKVKYNVKIKN